MSTFPVLLVEDKDSLRAMLRHALEAQDHLVGHAGSPGYLITAFAMSCVFTISGRFSSASICMNFAPFGTA